MTATLIKLNSSKQITDCCDNVTHPAANIVKLLGLIKDSFRTSQMLPIDKQILLRKVSNQIIHFHVSWEELMLNI